MNRDIYKAPRMSAQDIRICRDVFELINNGQLQNEPFCQYAFDSRTEPFSDDHQWSQPWVGELKVRLDTDINISTERRDNILASVKYYETTLSSDQYENDPNSFRAMSIAIKKYLQDAITPVEENAVVKTSTIIVEIYNILITDNTPNNGDYKDANEERCNALPDNREWQSEFLRDVNKTFIQRSIWRINGILGGFLSAMPAFFSRIYYPAAFNVLLRRVNTAIRYFEAIARKGESNPDRNAKILEPEKRMVELLVSIKIYEGFCRDRYYFDLSQPDFKAQIEPFIAKLDNGVIRSQVGVNVAEADCSEMSYNILRMVLEQTDEIFRRDTGVHNDKIASLVSQLEKVTSEQNELMNKLAELRRMVTALNNAREENRLPSEGARRTRCKSF